MNLNNRIDMDAKQIEQDLLNAQSDLESMQQEAIELENAVSSIQSQMDDLAMELQKTQERLQRLKGNRYTFHHDGLIQDQLKRIKQLEYQLTIANNTPAPLITTEGKEYTKYYYISRLTKNRIYLKTFEGDYEYYVNKSGYGSTLSSYEQKRIDWDASVARYKEHNS